MALTKEQKEALNDHYKNKELYHPATAPEQEVSTFKPKPILGEPKGYDEGGSVTGDDFSVDGGASDTAKDNGNPLTLATDGDQGAVATLVNKMGPPQIPPQLPLAAPPIPSTMTATPSQAEPVPSDQGPSVDAPVQPFGRHSGAAGWSNDPNAGAAGNSSGLPNDQYAQLVAALSKGPSGGQIAASGLGALADGIMQGVARAGNPGFQKGIDERSQQQKENLINALRAKYDTQFRGQELGINQQRANDENTRAKAALASEDARAKAERVTQERGQDVAARTAGAERDIQASNQSRQDTQAKITEAQKAFQDNKYALPFTDGRAIRNQAEAYLSGHGDTASSAPVKIMSRAQFDSLPKGATFIDNSGKVKVKH